MKTLEQSVIRAINPIISNILIMFLFLFNDFLLYINNAINDKGTAIRRELILKASESNDTWISCNNRDLSGDFNTFIKRIARVASVIKSGLPMVTHCNITGADNSVRTCHFPVLYSNNTPAAGMMIKAWAVRINHWVWSCKKARWAQSPSPTRPRWRPPSLIIRPFKNAWKAYPTW